MEQTPNLQARPELLPGGHQDSRESTAAPTEFKKLATGILSFAAQRLAFGALVLLFIIFLSHLGLDMAAGARWDVAAKSALPGTLSYIGRALRGDLGLSAAGSDAMTPVPVVEVLSERFPRTLGLLGASLLFAALVGVGLGISASRSRSQWSLGIILSTLIGVSVPSFFAAFLLQWLLTSLTRQLGRPILPVGGFGWDKHLVLPMVVLAARPIAQITRITYVSLRDVLAQDYVRTARSKGLQKHRITFIHVLRNASIPILTTIGVSLRFSLSSLPVVEYYFGWPGAGFSLLRAVARQDVNLTTALAAGLGILFILMNLALELSYRLIDPRLWEKPAHVAASEQQNLLQRVKSYWSNLSYVVKNGPLARWTKRGQVDRSLPKLPTPKAKEEAKLEEEPALARRPQSLWRTLANNIPFTAGSLLVLGLILIVFLGPRLSPNSPYHTLGLVNIDGELKAPPFPPGGEYPWGTDNLGRGLLSLVLSGAQQTLFLGLLAVSARMVLGTLLGAIAGWKNGSRLDRFILGLAEVMAAFPTLLMAMILIIGFNIRKGMEPFVLGLCFVGWGEIMQFVRGQVMAIRPKAFVESAVAVGVRTPRIVYRHIMPNLFSALISILALEMGAVLMLLGELGFIGIFIGGGSSIGLPTGTFNYSDVPEWGALLSNVRYQARSYPWTGLYPMLAFFVSIVTFNLLGEGLRRMVEEGNIIINRFINRYTVAFAAIALVGGVWLGSNSGALVFYQEYAAEFNADQALAHIAELSSPPLQGRALGSPGMDAAADYIAGEFEALGLQAAGDAGSYFQQRSRAFQRLLSVPKFGIHDGGSTPVPGIDFAPYPGRYMTDGLAAGPVRFVGLGIRAPLQMGNFRISYPDLMHADYGGEILMTMSDQEAWLLDGVPARGLLVVAEDSSQMQRRETLSGRSGAGFDFSLNRVGAETPSLWISEEMAERLLQGSGYSLESLRQVYSELGTEQLFEAPLAVETSMEVEGFLEEKWPVRNVIGYIPGTHGYDSCADCLGKNLIVVMAQYDGPPLGPDGSILPGANDNASSIGVMLEAIRVIQETDYQPYKTLLFVAYSGEGVEGGESVSEPEVTTFLQTRGGFSTSFNLEAIVRLRGLGGGSGDRLQVSAGGSLRLAELLESAAKKMGCEVIRSADNIDLAVIYGQDDQFLRSGEEAPTVRLSWEGWSVLSHLASDSLENLSQDSIEQAGRTLALSLMVLGRETDY